MPSTQNDLNDNSKNVINTALEKYMEALKDLLPDEPHDQELELDGYDLNAKDKKADGSSDCQLNFLNPDICINPENAHEAIRKGLFVDANKHRYAKNATKALWNVAFRTRTIINLGKLSLALRVTTLTLITSDKPFIERNFSYQQKDSEAPLVINEETLQLALITREFLQTIKDIDDPFSMIPNKFQWIIDFKKNLKAKLSQIIQNLDDGIAKYKAMTDPKVIQTNVEIKVAIKKLTNELLDTYNALNQLRSTFNTLRSEIDDIIKPISTAERLELIEGHLTQIKQIRHDLATLDLKKKKEQTLQEFKTRFPQVSWEYFPKSIEVLENAEAAEEVEKSVLRKPTIMKDSFNRLIPSETCNNKYDTLILKIKKLQLEDTEKLAEKLEEDLVTHQELTELQQQTEKFLDKGLKEKSLEDELVSALQAKNYPDLSSIEIAIQQLNHIETELKKQLELDEMLKSTLLGFQVRCKELMEKHTLSIFPDTYQSECKTLDLRITNELSKINSRIEQTQNSLTAVPEAKQKLEYQRQKQAAKENLSELNKLLAAQEKKLEQKFVEETQLRSLLTYQPAEKSEIHKQLKNIELQISQRLNLRKKLTQLKAIHEKPAIYQTDFDELATAMDWDEEDKVVWKNVFEAVRSSQTGQAKGGIISSYLSRLYASFKLSDFNWSIGPAIESRISEIEKQLNAGKMIKDLEKQKILLLKQLEYQENLQSNLKEQANLETEIQNLRQEINGIQVKTLDTEIKELILVIKDRKDSITQLEEQCNSRDSKNPYKVRQECQTKVNKILAEKFEDKINKIEEKLKKLVARHEVDLHMKDLRNAYSQLEKKIGEFTTIVKNKKENDLNDSIKSDLQSRRNKIYNDVVDGIQKYTVKRQKEYAVKDFFSNLKAIFLRQFDYKTETTKQIEYLDRLKILLATFKVTDDTQVKTALEDIILAGKKDPALKPLLNLLSYLEKELNGYVWYKASLNRENKPGIDLDVYNYKDGNTSIYHPR